MCILEAIASMPGNVYRKSQEGYLPTRLYFKNLTQNFLIGVGLTLFVLGILALYKHQIVAGAVMTSIGATSMVIHPIILKLKSSGRSIHILSGGDEDLKATQTWREWLKD